MVYKTIIAQKRISFKISSLFKNETYYITNNENKLVRSFVEQIAVQWKRSNIETVSDAIEMALAEYDEKNKKKPQDIVVFLSCVHNFVTFCFILSKTVAFL